MINHAVFEDSKTEWKESATPFIKVATITIPRQAFDSEAQIDFCENLSFTPWHALPEPLGRSRWLGACKCPKGWWRVPAGERHEM